MPMLVLLANRRCSTSRLTRNLSSVALKAANSPFGLRCPCQLCWHDGRRAAEARLLRWRLQVVRCPINGKHFTIWQWYLCLSNIATRHWRSWGKITQWVRSLIIRAIFAAANRADTQDMVTIVLFWLNDSSIMSLKADSPILPGYLHTWYQYALKL